MNSSCSVRVDLRRSLFLDGRYDNVEPLRPRRVEHKKGKLAIAGDEAKFFVLDGHEIKLINKTSSQSSTRHRRRKAKQRVKITCFGELSVATMSEISDRWVSIQISFDLGSRPIPKEHRQCTLILQSSCATCPSRLCCSRS